MSYRSPAALAAAIAALTIPAGASAATKTVAAGPPLTKTPPGLKNFGDFNARLAKHFARLGALDVNYRRP